MEGRSSRDSPVEGFDASSKCFHDLADAPYLVEFDLELVDLAQDLAETGDLGVGGLDEVPGTIILRLGCGLGLRGELTRGCDGVSVNR